MLDLFCGSGTTLIAAVESGRRAAGCDASPAAIDAAFARLAAAGHPVVVERPGAERGAGVLRLPEGALRWERQESGLSVRSYVPPRVPDWPGSAEAVRAADPERGLPLLVGWGLAEMAPDGSVRLHAWVPLDGNGAPAVSSVPVPSGMPAERLAVLAIDRFGNRVSCRIQVESTSSGSR